MSRTAGEEFQRIFNDKKEENEKQDISLKLAKKLMKKLIQSELLIVDSENRKKNDERAGYFYSLAERLQYEKDYKKFLEREAERGIVKKLWSAELSEKTFYEEILNMHNNNILWAEGEKENPEKTAEKMLQHIFYYLSSYIRIQNKLKRSEVNDS
jgi:hypothetical protein